MKISFFNDFAVFHCHPCCHSNHFVTTWYNQNYLMKLPKKSEIGQSDGTNDSKIKEQWVRFYLKLVSAIFFQFFIFSPNDSHLKTMKSVFYFILKALFILKIFKFFYFFPFLSILARYKKTNGSGIIYNAMNWLA